MSKKTIKKLYIFQMGGTIASLSENKATNKYGSPSENISDLLENLDYDKSKLVFHEFCQKISHDIAWEEIIELAKIVQELLDKNDTEGVVITVGTNAIEDIAYFISLVVNTKKAIVLTGAHYPQNGLIFDGTKNIYNALIIASSKEAIGLGVLLTFNDVVISARYATKVFPGVPNDFCFNGIGQIGVVVSNKFMVKSKPVCRQTYRSEFNIENIKFMPKIHISYGFLGMDELQIKIAIESRVSGIVCAGFGTGYFPKNLIDVLVKAVNSGIPVVRCPRSGIGHGVIDTGYDDRYGFISAPNHQPHKASVLLSVALNQKYNRKKFQKIFREY